MKSIPVLKVVELTKAYQGFKAVDQVSFELAPGSITVLQGPNGSGKTTLLHCVTGLILPTSGTILIDGLDPQSHWRETRSAMAFVPDVPRFYLELTAYEQLRFIAAANNVLEGFEARAETLLTRFGLSQVKDGFPHHFSRGMRLKLGLLMGLIRPAKLFILDEPTSAIDAQGRELLIAELIDRKAPGMAILLSTHDTTLAQQLNADILTIDSGRIMRPNLASDHVNS